MATGTPSALLAALRAGGVGADMARETLDAGASNADDLRVAVTSLLAADLGPTDRAITRWLLEQETAAQAAHGSGASETLVTLVAALARFGSPSDALALWRARLATPETRAAIDPEQFMRAGVDATRTWLEGLTRQTSPDASEARAALAWLDEEGKAGAFDDLAAYFTWSDDRFGIHINGPT